MDMAVWVPQKANSEMESGQDVHQGVAFGIHTRGRKGMKAGVDRGDVRQSCSQHCGALTGEP